MSWLCIWFALILTHVLSTTHALTLTEVKGRGGSESGAVIKPPY